MHLTNWPGLIPSVAYTGDIMNRYFSYYASTIGFAGMMAILIIIALVVGAAQIDWPDFEKQDNNASVSNPVYAPVTVNTPVSTPFPYELTQSQFVPDHHQLVCSKAGSACDFGIYRAGDASFDMGMSKTNIPYSETTMTVFPHVQETALEVGQVYAECTLTTYALTVNGAPFTGCFEGIFQGRDGSGYHFLSNGQMMTLPHTHGAFLSPHSN